LMKMRSPRGLTVETLRETAAMDRGVNDVQGLAPVAPRASTDLALKPVECQPMCPSSALATSALCG
jgi:hypothetical protein